MKFGAPRPTTIRRQFSLNLGYNSDHTRNIQWFEHEPIVAEYCHNIDSIYECPEHSLDMSTEIFDVIEPTLEEPTLEEPELEEPTLEEPELEEPTLEEPTIVPVCPPRPSIVRCRSVFDVLQAARRESWMKRILEIPPVAEVTNTVIPDTLENNP